MAVTMIFAMKQKTRNTLWAAGPHRTRTSSQTVWHLRAFFFSSTARMPKRRTYKWVRIARAEREEGRGVRGLG